MTADDDDDQALARVDPRAPRFGQGLTASLLLVAIALEQPALVYLVAVILGVAVVSGWRLDVYALLWRHGVRRIVASPSTREGAPPHRFAKLLGATGSVTASLLLFAGFTGAGYVIALLIALLAGLAAVTGLCVGCKMYSQVSYLHRHDIV